jgi:hypothetical protein
VATYVLFICKTKSRLRRRHCGLARHFKTDPAESVALFWIREDTFLTTKALWPGASFQNRSYKDRSSLFWIHFSDELMNRTFVLPNSNMLDETRQSRVFRLKSFIFALCLLELFELFDSKSNNHYLKKFVGVQSRKVLSVECSKVFLRKIVLFLVHMQVVEQSRATIYY